MFELLVALPLLVKALILGIVEGLTEFLPISSTGHLILAGSVLGFHGDKAKIFDVAIQTGAMFAVIVYFRERLTKVLKGFRTEPVQQRFILNILIAFMPAAVLGVMFASRIKEYLFYPVPVAIALVVGGLIIMWVEVHNRRRQQPPRITDVDQMSRLDALKLGIAQSFALIPGMSRSGSTIIGGMLFGLSRQSATEFSFYLAIPTLIGAGVYDTWKYRHLLSADDIPLFAVGTIVAFFSAWACVAWLIRYVASRDFIPFAWYRIGFGLVILITAYTGVVDWASA
ncbi:MAG: undecaprenyl-diphosphate phosphatase [Burkholderiaceae bacterium]